MSEFLSDLAAMRAHLIKTLVDFGRSEEGATRQVADFEHAVRMQAINDTAMGARRNARQTHKGL